MDRMRRPEQPTNGDALRPAAVGVVRHPAAPVSARWFRGQVASRVTTSLLVGLLLVASGPAPAATSRHQSHNQTAPASVKHGKHKQQAQSRAAGGHTPAKPSARSGQNDRKRGQMAPEKRGDGNVTPGNNDDTKPTGNHGGRDDAGKTRGKGKTAQPGNRPGHGQPRAKQSRPADPANDQDAGKPAPTAQPTAVAPDRTAPNRPNPVAGTGTGNKPHTKPGAVHRHPDATRRSNRKPAPPANRSATGHPAPARASTAPRQSEPGAQPAAPALRQPAADDAAPLTPVAAADPIRQPRSVADNAGERAALEPTRTANADNGPDHGAADPAEDDRTGRTEPAELRDNPPTRAEPAEIAPATETVQPDETHRPGSERGNSQLAELPERGAQPERAVDAALVLVERPEPRRESPSGADPTGEARAVRPESAPDHHPAGAEPTPEPRVAVQPNALPTVEQPDASARPGETAHADAADLARREPGPLHSERAAGDDRTQEPGPEPVPNPTWTAQPEPAVAPPDRLDVASFPVAVSVAPTPDTARDETGRRDRDQASEDASEVKLSPPMPTATAAPRIVPAADLPAQAERDDPGIGEPASMNRSGHEPIDPSGAVDGAANPPVASGVLPGAEPIAGPSLDRLPLEPVQAEEPVTATRTAVSDPVITARGVNGEAGTPESAQEDAAMPDAPLTTVQPTPTWAPTVPAESDPSDRTPQAFTSVPAPVPNGSGSAPLDAPTEPAVNPGSGEQAANVAPETVGTNGIGPSLIDPTPAPTRLPLVPAPTATVVVETGMPRAATPAAAVGSEPPASAVQMLTPAGGDFPGPVDIVPSAADPEPGSGERAAGGAVVASPQSTTIPQPDAETPVEPSPVGPEVSPVTPTATPISALPTITPAAAPTVAIDPPAATLASIVEPEPVIAPTSAPLPDPDSGVAITPIPIPDAAGEEPPAASPVASVPPASEPAVMDVAPGPSGASATPAPDAPPVELPDASPVPEITSETAVPEFPSPTSEAGSLATPEVVMYPPSDEPIAPPVVDATPSITATIASPEPTPPFNPLPAPGVATPETELATPEGASASPVATHAEPAPESATPEPEPTGSPALATPTVFAGAEAVTITSLTADNRITPGQPSRYHFLLINTADIPALVRPVPTNSLSDWTGRVLDENGSFERNGSLVVEPGQSVNVVIEVTAPSNAHVGDRNTISLQVVNR